MLTNIRRTNGTPPPMIAPHVAEVVKAFKQLGTLPQIRKRLFDLADDPITPVAGMAEVIAQDPCLTVRVIAEASKRARRGDIGDVFAAITFMNRDDIVRGVEQTYDRDGFEKIDRQIVNFMVFWSHSVCCALAASAIARKSSVGDPVSMYAIGLLHDVGEALLYLLKPREINRLLKSNCTENADWVKKERFELGIDHGEIASILFEHLGFPDRICETIRYHHEPHRARNYEGETYVLHVAEAIAQEVMPGWNSGSMRHSMEAIDPNAMRVIPNCVEIMDVIRQEVKITLNYVSDMIQPEAW